jgi:hypothetical protein
MWMSTAGNEWNPWSRAHVYAPMLFEMQNYLASQGGSDARLLGAGNSVTLDPSLFPANLKEVRALRTFYRPEAGQKEKELDAEWATEVTPESKDEPAKDKKKAAKQPRVFEFKPTTDPGFALVEYFDGVKLERFSAKQLQKFKDNRGNLEPIEAISQVYNVDARREGNLARVSQDEMESNLLREANSGRRPDQKAITFLTPEGRFDDLVARPQDVSQLPWFFLLFLGILVAEQALAVHLSFHLRASEAELPAQVAKPQARAA